MKRKLIILFVALTTFLSAFGGLASFLTTGPPNPAETSPVTIAATGPDVGPSDGGPPGPTPDGQSWGG
jgi:hypothetical protein